MQPIAIDTGNVAMTINQNCMTVPMVWFLLENIGELLKAAIIHGAPITAKTNS